MGDLSANFSRREFRCNCHRDCEAKDPTVDRELIDILEAVREHFGVSVSISSGHRCEDHNRDVGGAKFSQHRTGRAADIKVRGVSASAVQDWFEQTYPDVYGMGRYTSFTHVDSRGTKARWSN